ncbi:hypothetical protein GPJ56_005036 [Histomonas meleagridis]|nr:hypothetical protein GPJ56_005036 [Histomonas meleagridis]
MNTQPLEFISLSLQLIVNTPPDARRAKEIGATFLFQSVKDRHLLEINAVPKFWEIFSQIVPNVILNESMPDTVKTLVVCTLSALAVYTYKYNESTIVQQYIVELGKRKEFETFVLLAVREILLDGQCFYGFSAEFLMSLILKTLLYNSSIVPRAQLFFIVAGLTGDTNFFLQIFPQLLSKFPQDQLHSLLSAIDTFSEKHANMFQDIITDFTQFLCSIALNRECSFRNLAIFILGSLAQGDPHMCMNTPFYQQVFQCLITVISEIDDTSPFEFDVNDVSPPACAAVIFHSICLKTGCDQYFIFLNQYQDLIFRQDPNNYTWQQAYAVLYAFTLLDSASIQAIVPNITSLDPANKAAIQAVLSNSLIIQFTQKLVSFLQPSVTNPRIRAVIYRNI